MRADRRGARVCAPLQRTGRVDALFTEYQQTTRQIPVGIFDVPSLDLKVSILVALANALESTVDALVLRPASATTDPAPLVAELAAVVDSLGSLSPAHQRRVAAILRGYLSVAPDETPQ